MDAENMHTLLRPGGTTVFTFNPQTEQEGECVVVAVAEVQSSSVVMVSFTVNVPGCVTTMTGLCWLEVPVKTPPNCQNHSTVLNWLFTLSSKN